MMSWAIDGTEGGKIGEKTSSRESQHGNTSPHQRGRDIKGTRKRAIRASRKRKPEEVKKHQREVRVKLRETHIRECTQKKGGLNSKLQENAEEVNTIRGYVQTTKKR